MVASRRRGRKVGEKMGSAAAAPRARLALELESGGVGMANRCTGIKRWAEPNERAGCAPVCGNS